MSAREKICAFLATGPATRTQIGESLGMTTDTVIHATNGLVTAGRIRGERPAGSGNGRPAVYSLFTSESVSGTSIVSHALASQPDLARVWAS